MNPNQPGLAAPGGPPLPLGNLHRAYSDLYSDPQADPFERNYINLYHEYAVGGGQAPAQLRDNLYNSGNAGTLIHILAHILDAGAAPEDPGYIVGYHRLTRHVTRFG